MYAEFQTNILLRWSFLGVREPHQPPANTALPLNQTVLPQSATLILSAVRELPDAISNHWWLAESPYGHRNLYLVTDESWANHFKEGFHLRIFDCHQFWYWCDGFVNQWKRERRGRERERGGKGKGREEEKGGEGEREKRGRGERGKV